LLLALPLLAGGGLLAWRFLSPVNKVPSAVNAPAPARVKLATVQGGATQDSSDFIASLQSRHSVKLQPKNQGQVSQILVKAGTLVTKGAAIMQITNGAQQAAVNSVNTAVAVAATQSQLANARTQLSELEARRRANEADVKVSQQEYEKYSRLADQGAISQNAIAQYANKIAVAQAALRATLEQIHAQQASIAQAEKSLQQSQANAKQPVQPQYDKITAPFRGIVGDIPVKLGDFVNTSTQLTTLTENHPLDVNFSVPIERQQQLHQGMLVQILDAQGHNVGSGQVFFITPSVQNNHQSILVKALFNNSKDQLRANQFVQARVIWNQPKGVFIPTTAVSPIAGENFVYVAQTQSSPQGNSQLVARQTRVKLGNIQGNNSQVQVLEGLAPGERIVVSGLANVKNGTPIIPEP
jgi:RND family efflux transporter MFP subunit